MEYLFTPAMFLPEDVGFPLYGTGHLLWLAGLAVMCVFLIVSYRRGDAAFRRLLCRSIAWGILVLEILRDGYLIACGAWEWNYSPLHPCSFTMFFMALWALRPGKVLGNLMYGYGLVGALLALLFCNWTDQPLWQFQSIYSFLFHGLLVGWILMVIVGGDLRPNGRGFLHSVVFLAIAAPITGVLNYILPDCNFFFTREGSEGSPLELFQKVFGSPWWLFVYAAAAALLLALEFLPWYLADRKREKQTL